MYYRVVDEYMKFINRGMKKIIPVKKPVANQDLTENALEMIMATLVFQPSELKFNIFTLYWWLFIFT